MILKLVTIGAIFKSFFIGFGGNGVVSTTGGRELTWSIMKSLWRFKGVKLKSFCLKKDFNRSVCVTNLFSYLTSSKGTERDDFTWAHIYLRSCISLWCFFPILYSNGDSKTWSSSFVTVFEAGVEDATGL